MNSCEIKDSASGFLSVMGIPAFLKPYVKWDYLGREELAGFDRYKVRPANFTCWFKQLTEGVFLN